MSCRALRSSCGGDVHKSFMISLMRWVLIFYFQFFEDSDRPEALVFFFWVEYI